MTDMPAEEIPADFPEPDYMGGYKNPQHTFVCPKCRSASQHLRIPLYVRVRDQQNIGVEPFRDDFEYEMAIDGIQKNQEGFRPPWTATVCLGCRKGSVWRDGKRVFPARVPSIQPHEDMPPKARGLFEEAVAVKGLSPRASAALARASLESFLKEHFSESKAYNLDERVAEAGRHISAELWEALTVLRVVGNEALHDGKIEMQLDGSDDAYIEPLLGAVNGLAEELISRPARTRALYEKLPDAKRTGAEQTRDRIASRDNPPQT